MGRFSRFYFAFFSALAILAGAVDVRAEKCKVRAPLEEDGPRVNVLSIRGKKELEDNEPAKAEATFLQVENISPCFPPAVYWLAKSREAQGKYLAALATYDRIRNVELKDIDLKVLNKDILTDAVRNADTSAARLTQIIPTIEVRLNGRPVPSAARVLVDDHDEGSTNAPIQVDPGRHRIAVEADGFVRASEEISISDSERKVIMLPIFEIEFAPDPFSSGFEEPTLKAAREQFNAGVEYAVTQEWEKAHAAFEASEKIRSHPHTIFNDALVQYKRKQYVRSWSRFGEAMLQSREPGMLAWVVDRAGRHRDEIERILAKPRVTISVQGASLRLNDRPLEPLADPSTNWTFSLGTSSHGPVTALPSNDFHLLLDPSRRYRFVVTKEGFETIDATHQFTPGAKTAVTFSLVPRRRVKLGLSLLGLGVAAGLAGIITDVAMANDGVDNGWEWTPVALYVTGTASAATGVVFLW